MIIRELHSIPDYRAVMTLEHDIWGYGDPEDAVGIPMFVITIKRGGILLGAYDGPRLIGFVYALAGLKDGRPMLWSHMLGVVDGYRATGIGRELKLAQRRLALARGIDLMEWTFDPLQTVNAHLNFRRLGAVAAEYHVNVYGESSSTLHRGNPTDRLIAQWWMRSPRVARIADAAPGTPPFPAAGQGDPFADAEPVLERRDGPGGADPSVPRLDSQGPRLTVAVPAGFTAMLEGQPSRAAAWRMATRDVFAHYLGRGYVVEDFVFDAGRQDGRYLLEAGGAARPATVAG